MKNQKYEVVRKNIMDCGVQFDKIGAKYGRNFEEEAVYAIQQVQRNDYSTSVAMNNPTSLRMSVLNAATAGISLNPSLDHGYLLPRKNQICLDISYKGLIHLAITSGSVSWVQAEVVCEADTFTMKGVGEAPDHVFDPFKQRGSMVGVYCVARLPNGDYLTDTMSMEEIIAIRDKSEAFKRSKSGPWVTHFNEMAKKSVVKKAYKYWPKGDGRVHEAIRIINEHEGIKFEDEYDDQLSPEEKAVGNHYRLINGKYREMQLKDFDRPQLEEYRNFLEKQLASGNRRPWHSDQLEVIESYLNDWEHHRALLVDDEEFQE